MTLQEKVKDLESITGCLGGFVLRGGRSVYSGLPAVYDRDRLDRVAAHVKKLAAMAEKSGYPNADFVLRFGKATLLLQSLGDGAHLALACEPTANLATVEVFAGVAADDIREALATYQEEEEEEEILTISVPPPEPTPDPRVVLENARKLALATYADRLSRAKTLLIAEVGPIGEIIFGNALDAWVTSGAVDWTRASVLRDSLAHEIDNPKARASFASNPVWKSS